MSRTLISCLLHASSFLGTLFLLASVVLSACAIPILLLALFWLK